MRVVAGRGVPLARVAGLLSGLALVAGCTGAPTAATSTGATASGSASGEGSRAASGAVTTSTAATSSPDPATAIGTVTHVVDGDTFVLTLGGTPAGTEERVRVLGIDTPERDECGYAEASAAASRLLQGATVTLVADPTQDDRDRYGRWVRSVRLPDGSDLGHRMVADGLAREYTYDRPYALQSDYRTAQTDAADAGRGLWSKDSCGGFTATTSGSTSVASSRLSSPVGPDPTGTEVGPPSPDCDIKGNISGNGRIYHLPGTRDYDRTGIDESRGERWFCSVEEAQAAGWRAPGQG